MEVEESLTLRERGLVLTDFPAIVLGLFSRCCYFYAYKFCPNVNPSHHGINFVYAKNILLKG